MADQKIIVDGQEITIKQVDNSEYISLTDMAKGRETRPIVLIQSWLKNNSTLRFLEAWEKIYNPDFKVHQMVYIKAEQAENARFMSPKQWIERTDAIGIQSKSGRYGGTYAHIDIAFEFATWLSPEFKMFLIVEFKRLKLEETKRLNLEFDQTRFLTKVNYTLQTKAIEENILPRLNRANKPFVFANEADLLNQVVFGLTAQQWRENNPDLKGNIRDNASLLELNILNNLQSRNAELIKDGVEAELRFRVLLKVAQNQFKVLAEDKRLSPPDEQNLIE